MNDDITAWLNDDDWTFIQEMRQPKPMPPARKKKTVTRYADMKPEKAAHKRKQKKKWMNDNHEKMLDYWVQYRKRHHEATKEASRKWQKRFRQEHGVCYQTWRNWKKTPAGRARIAAWEAEHKEEAGGCASSSEAETGF